MEARCGLPLPFAPDPSVTTNDIDTYIAFLTPFLPWLMPSAPSPIIS